MHFRRIYGETPMRINVAFAIPPTSIKYDSWHDGFTAAIQIISNWHDIGSTFTQIRQRLKPTPNSSLIATTC